jgi:hypothetical protein
LIFFQQQKVKIYFNIVQFFFVFRIGFKELLGTQALWHYLLSMPIVPCILCVVLISLFCPESPRALISAEDGESRARDVLAKLRATHNVNAELNQLNIENEDSGNGETISLLQLFRMKEYRMPLFVGLVLQLTQQFSGINAVSIPNNIAIRLNLKHLIKPTVRFLFHIQDLFLLGVDLQKCPHTSRVHSVHGPGHRCRQRHHDHCGCAIDRSPRSQAPPRLPPDRCHHQLLRSHLLPGLQSKR